MDPASLGISGLGALELLLAMKMSAVNGEQMKVMRTSSDPKKAGAAFLRSPYYRSWSRAQLNNAEYAPVSCRGHARQKYLHPYLAHRITNLFPCLPTRPRVS